MGTRRKGVGFLIWLLAVIIMTFASRWVVPSRNVDVAIRNGLLVDGSGKRPGRQDLFITDGRITQLGLSWRRIRGQLEIDASGLVVAPGFVDVHTHIERSLPEKVGGPFRAWNFMRQGVTSIITGNCGTSLISVPELRSIMDRGGGQVNVATLVGHNSVRKEVLKNNPNRRPTTQELKQMRAVVRRALEDGALGLSTGLGYEPGIFVGIEEIEYVGGDLADFGGIYVTHVRNESFLGAQAIREAIETSRLLEVPLQISHLKTAGRRQWGQMEMRLADLDEAEGEVFFDVYPYTASSTSIDPLLPELFFQHPSFSRRSAFRTKASHSLLKAGMREILSQNGWEDYEFVQIASFWADRSRDGLRIPDLVSAAWEESADNRFQLDCFDSQASILIDMALRGGAQLVYHEMCDEDVRAAILHDRAMIGSDSGVRYPDMDAKPHPRGMGTFPRVISKYVRKEGVLSLENAVRKMTSLPAERMSLGRRGLLEKDFWGDVVVFDFNRIEDVATYDDPLLPPIGIHHVFVNGVPTMLNGIETGMNPGVFIPRGGNH